MNAYEHLKLKRLFKTTAIYKRFLDYIDGYDNALTKKEFEDFQKEYMRHHAIVVGRIEKTLSANKFKQLTK